MDALTLRNYSGVREIVAKATEALNEATQAARDLLADADVGANDDQ